jgi:5'(3')-deoxyribonucleotidase
MRIYFDLDGVLLDFVKGLFERLHLNVNPYPFPKGVYDIFPYFESKFKISQSKVFSVLREESFWENLELNPKGKELFDLVVKKLGKDSVFFLSRPIVGMPYSFSGKYKSVVKNFPGFSKNIILATPHKDFIDKKGIVLIDDSDEEINLIKEGKGILFPQPWNSRWKEVDISTQDLFLEIIE